MAVEDYRVLLYNHVFDKKPGGGFFHADGVTPVSRPNQTQPQAAQLTRDWAAC